LYQTKTNNNIMEQSQIISKKTFEITPLFGTIFVAVIGLIGTGIGNLIGGYNNIQLEKEKLRSSLILKAIDTQNPESALNFLKLLKDTKLVDNIDITIAAWEKDSNSVPLRPSNETILSEGINNTDKNTRLLALANLLQKSTGNADIIKENLISLNQENIRSLKKEALVNVFVFLKRTEISIWSKELIELANTNIMNLENAIQNGSFTMGPQAKSEMRLFNDHLKVISNSK